MRVHGSRFDYITRDTGPLLLPLFMADHWRFFIPLPLCVKEFDEAIVGNVAAATNLVGRNECQTASLVSGACVVLQLA